METERLREFIVVAKHGKLAPAARELCLSASTLSDHVISLENELGAPLFDRAGGFKLTPAGETVLERAQRVLIECDAMRRACTQHKGTFTTIRFPNYAFGSKPFVVTSEAFHKGHPDCRITFKTNELQMADPFDIIADRSTDISCLYTIPGSGQDPDRMVPAGYAHLNIGTMDYVALTTKNHRLANKSVLSIEDFEGAVLLSSLCPLADISFTGVQDYFSKRGVSISTMFRRLNRHDDLLTTDLDDFIILRMAQAENAATSYDDDLVVHELDFPLAIAVDLVWNPAALDQVQTAFMAEMAALVKRGKQLV